MLGRGVVAERLVRPFVVVDALEAAQALKLLAPARRRRRGGVLQQQQYVVASFRSSAGCPALDDALADLLNPAIGQGTAGLGSQTGLKPPARQFLGPPRRFRRCP